MDILLIFYTMLFFGIMLAPFILIIRKNSSELKTDSIYFDLNSRREILLDNLKDLKTEMDTGKFSYSEFTDISTELVEELKEIDNKLNTESVKNEVEISKNMICSGCSYEIQTIGAKFCPMCGKEIEVI